MMDKKQNQIPDWQKEGRASARMLVGIILLAASLAAWGLIALLLWLV